MKYVKGNLFDLVEPGMVVPHVCNNQAVMGSGFVIPLKAKYPSAEEEYLKMPQILGTTGFVPQEDKVVIANMIAQDFTYNPIPLYYDALEACMVQIKYFCQKFNHWQIMCPKFGSLRAGGDWDHKIWPLIVKIWEEGGIHVTCVEYSS